MAFLRGQLTSSERRFLEEVRSLLTTILQRLDAFDAPCAIGADIDSALQRVTDLLGPNDPDAA